MRTPQRIVCLTEETVETLYLLGCEDRIVGVSGFAVRPPGVRSKPRISTFTEANTEEIVALRPDLVFAFSDLQADIVRELVRRGLNVVAFNQRTIDEILGVIETVGRLVGCGGAAEALTGRYQTRMQDLARTATETRPRVYFEEWFDPLISGIRWVSELIVIAGGRDVFEHKSHAHDAKGRIVRSDEVVQAGPDIIIGSWCGKMFKPDVVRQRPGWSAIPAVADGRLHEIRSSAILQPGPAALTDGLDALVAIIRGEVRRV